MELPLRAGASFVGAGIVSPNRNSARVAVLGAGAIAQVVHLPILSRMRGVELAVLCDSDRAKAQTLAGRFGVERVCASPDEVYGDDAVDAVVVCTPSNLHEEHVRGALETGKYVLCEKPLALSAEAVERLLRVPGADERLLVAMNQRFRPDAAALRTFVAGGELGDVYYLKTGWLNRRTVSSRRSWRQRKTSAGGGVLMDLGVQVLDLALWLLGYPEPERVVAHFHREPGSEVEDSAALMLRLQGGRLVNLEVAWGVLAERDRHYLHLLGDSGSGSLSPLAVFKEMDTGLVEVTPQLPPGRENLFTASYRQELQHFVDAVRNRQNVEAPREQVTLMRTVAAAYRSAEEGREVQM